MTLPARSTAVIAVFSIVLATSVAAYTEDVPNKSYNPRISTKGLERRPLRHAR